MQIVHHLRKAKDTEDVEKLESFQNDVIVYSPSFKYKIDLVGWLKYFFLPRKDLYV